MYYLSDNEIQTFFSCLSRLPRGDIVALYRSLGQQLDDCSMSTRIAYLSCLPTAIHNQEQLQDLFFVAGVYCKAHSTNCRDVELSNTESGVIRIEQEIARVLQDGAYTEQSATTRFRDILGARTGTHGTLYRILARLLRNSDNPIDCWSLIRDLEHWNDPSQSVQRKWANARIQSIRQDAKEP